MERFWGKWRQARYKKYICKKRWSTQKEEPKKPLEAEINSQEEETISQRLLGGEDKTPPVKDNTFVITNENLKLKHNEKDMNSILSSQKSLPPDSQQWEQEREQGECTSPNNSPNWDSLEEETIAEIEMQVADQKKETVEVPTKEKGKDAKAIEQNKGGEPVRQSERIKKQ